MTTNEKILKFLNECGVFYYASVDNGKARVRPFGMAAIVNGKLYFGMGKHKRSYRETEENPYIEICACKGGEWLRIRGKAVFDWDPTTEQILFEQYPFLKEKYGPDSELTHAAFCLEEMEADYNNMQGVCEFWT